MAVNTKTMKDGAWYKFSWAPMSATIYGKFSATHSTEIHLFVTEGFWKGEHRGSDCYLAEDCSDIQILSVTCSEIQKLLPFTHPSKLKVDSPNSNPNHGFIKGAWYACTCNDDAVKFHSIDGNFFRYTEQLSARYSKDKNVVHTFEDPENCRSLKMYFRPDFLADMTFVNKYISKHEVQETLTVLPKHWCVKVLSEYTNYPKIAEWRRKFISTTEEQWISPGFICSDYRWRSSNTSYHEISEETFFNLVYLPARTKKLETKERPIYCPNVPDFSKEITWLVCIKNIFPFMVGDKTWVKTLLYTEGFSTSLRVEDNRYDFLYDSSHFKVTNIVPALKDFPKPNKDVLERIDDSLDKILLTGQKFSKGVTTGKTYSIVSEGLPITEMKGEVMKKTKQIAVVRMENITVTRTKTKLLKPIRVEETTNVTI